MKSAWMCGLGLLLPLPIIRAADEKKDAGLKVEGQLSPDDPKDKVKTKSPHKVHTFKIAAGAVFVIDLESDDFDSLLRLEDSTGEQLALNDDRGDGSLHSRITFKAEKEDTYRIIVTNLDAKAGKYRLTAKPGSPVAAELATIKNKLESKQQELFEQFQAAKTEAEKEKIKGRFFALAAATLTPLSEFAEKNEKDPAGREARKLVTQMIQMVGTSDAPEIGTHLQSLFDKTKDKATQGQAGLALSRNLTAQAGTKFNKDKAASAMLFEKAEATLTALEKSHGEVLGKQVDDALFNLRKLSVGKSAMEIDGEDMDGKKLKLSDYRGKVVVLTFWGSWCPPCVAMIPHEREIVKRLEKAPFVLIGVNSDRDRDKAKTFIEDKKMTWRSFWNGGSTGGPIASEWRVRSWPNIYVLDANGVIRYRDVRGEAMDHAVDTLIKELESKK